ncbi:MULTISPECIES: hypothetical protein [Streptomyces violaceusniger group]|uniref:Uncharacterized protein n=2 Tax=Streptomyces javensis TaxID=114698 RepID=A0ABS0R7R0_9ACTN|nr:hypothetical protein [Streptomyces javensis]MBI0313120.1 hypothetical protein [Streptomyces javensis]
MGGAAGSGGSHGSPHTASVSGPEALTGPEARGAFGPEHARAQAGR